MVYPQKVKSSSGCSNMTGSIKFMFLQKPTEVSGIDGKITCFYSEKH